MAGGAPGTCNLASVGRLLSVECTFARPPDSLFKLAARLSRGARGAAGGSCSSYRGKRTVNVVPVSRVDTTLTAPSCDFTIASTM